jgi:hypothetical protein
MKSLKIVEIFRRLVSEAKRAEEMRASQLLQRRKDAVLLRKQIADHEKARWATVQENWTLGTTLRQAKKTHDRKVEAYMQEKMSQAEYAILLLLIIAK